MAKNLLYTILLAFISLSSTAQQTLTPLELNDKLATITDSLYSLGQSWGTKLGEVYSTKKFTELTPYRKKLENFLNTNITMVKNMKDVNSSKDLRMGMISFLQFEQKMMMSSFTPIDHLTANATDAQIEAAINKLKAESQKEAKELQKFGVLQEAYAQKNGFKIEAKKEE